MTPRPCQNRALFSKRVRERCAAVHFRDRHTYVEKPVVDRIEERSHQNSAFFVSLSLLIEKSKDAATPGRCGGGGGDLIASIRLREGKIKSKGNPISRFEGKGEECVSLYQYDVNFADLPGLAECCNSRLAHSSHDNNVSWGSCLWNLENQDLVGASSPPL